MDAWIGDDIQAQQLCYSPGTQSNIRLRIRVSIRMKITVPLLLCLTTAAAAGGFEPEPLPELVANDTFVEFLTLPAYKRID